VNGAPFALSGAVHLVRPTHRVAHDLAELRAALVDAPIESLFYHAVDVVLRSASATEIPPDDFSAWAHGVLQDGTAAERLSFAVQGADGGPAELRERLLGALADVRSARRAPEGAAFVFLTSESVPIATGRVAEDGESLLRHLAEADPSVWYYHLVEQRWFAVGDAPLLEWLRTRGEPRLAEWLLEAARSGKPIARVRRQVLARWRRSRLGPRIAAAASEPEAERREAAHQAVAGLVRRLQRGEAAS